jgi:hypothetical protein
MSAISFENISLFSAADRRNRALQPMEDLAARCPQFQPINSHFSQLFLLAPIPTFDESDLWKVRVAGSRAAPTRNVLGIFPLLARRATRIGKGAQAGATDCEEQSCLKAGVAVVRIANGMRCSSRKETGTSENDEQWGQTEHFLFTIEQLQKTSRLSPSSRTKDDDAVLRY